PLQTKLTFRVPDLTDSEQQGWLPFDTDADYRRTEKDSDHLFFCKHTRHSCIYKQTIILRGIRSHGRTAHYTKIRPANRGKQTHYSRRGATVAIPNRGPNLRPISRAPAVAQNPPCPRPPGTRAEVQDIGSCHQYSAECFRRLRSGCSGC